MSALVYRLLSALRHVIFCPTHNGKWLTQQLPSARRAPPPSAAAGVVADRRRSRRHTARRAAPCVCVQLTTPHSAPSHFSAAIMALEAIRYSRGSLELLDQRLLPLQSVYVRIDSAEAAHAAIVNMTVRGAPGLAVAAGLAVALELAADGAVERFATGDAAAGAWRAQLRGRGRTASAAAACACTGADARPHAFGGVAPPTATARFMVVRGPRSVRARAAGLPGHKARRAPHATHAAPRDACACGN
jgi:hypothetical protein